MSASLFGKWKQLHSVWFSPIVYLQSVTPRNGLLAAKLPEVGLPPHPRVYARKSALPNNGPRARLCDTIPAPD